MALQEEGLANACGEASCRNPGNCIPGPTLGLAIRCSYHSLEKKHACVVLSFEIFLVRLYLNYMHHLFIFTYNLLNLYTQWDKWIVLQCFAFQIFMTILHFDLSNQLSVYFLQNFVNGKCIFFFLQKISFDTCSFFSILKIICSWVPDIKNYVFF